MNPQELKKKVIEILDADKDGKLSFEDAKAIALSMSKGISDATRASVLTWLDADGDGTVTSAEASSRLQELSTRLWPYRHSLWASCGFICTFYGQNFKYTILFGRTFATTGWPTLEPAIRELGASYRRGRKAAQAHGPEIARAKEVLAKIKKDVRSEDAKQKLAVDAVDALAAARSLQDVMAAVDPKKVWAVVKSAYVGVSASFASVLSASAARLGVGVGLGEAIGSAVNAVVSPVIAAQLRKLRDRAINNDDLRAAFERLDVDDAALEAWTDTTISALSTALGIYVAHRVDDVVYLYSACLAGATLAVDHLLHLLPATIKSFVTPRLKQLVLVALAAAGFAYQKVLGRGQLPLVLKLPLTPLALAESILDKMAINIRAASLVTSP